MRRTTLAVLALCAPGVHAQIVDVYTIVENSPTMRRIQIFNGFVRTQNAPANVTSLDVRARDPDAVFTIDTPNAVGSLPVGFVDPTVTVFTPPAPLRGVNHDGSGLYYWTDGATVFRADAPGGFVPTPALFGFPGLVRMEVDFDRGVMLATDGVTLFTQPLDGSVPFSSFTPVGFDTVLGVEIEPFTGDFFWVEFNSASGASRLIRADTDFTNQSIVRSSTNPATALLGICVAGSDAAIAEGNAFTNDTTISRLDLNTGSTTFLTTYNGLSVEIECSFNAPLITDQPVPVTTESGTNASLAMASGDPGATFQWLKNGVPVSDDTRVTGATTDTLSFTPARSYDSDNYSCRVTGANMVTQDTDSVLLLVRSNGPDGCPADVNNDGLASPADFTAWLAAFQAGCP